MAMSKRTRKTAARSKRAMNPYAPLRAKTQQSKKKVASKTACRTYRPQRED